ncbi:MAG: EAL domain-containing protein, partial [Rhodocyclaceae bacterium]
MKAERARIDRSAIALQPRRWMAWTVLLGGLALTVLSWRVSVGNTERLAQSHFDARADELHAAIQSRLVAYAQVLRGGRAYIGSTGHPNRAQWARLYESLNISENYPGMTGIVYIRATPATERDAALKRIRRDEPDYAVRPPGERSYYTLVTTVEPRTPSNLKVIGSDSWSSPERRQILKSARDSGENRVTGKLNLVIDDPEKPTPAFLMYQAVYRQGQFPDNIEERRQQLLGFITAGFRIEALMRGTLGDIPQDVALRVYDSETPDKARLFHDSHSAYDFRQAGFQRQRTLSVGGRTWAIEFASLPAFEAEVRHRDQTGRLLGGGVLASLLLFAIVWSLAGTRARAVHLAEQMTHSLRNSKARMRELFAQAPVGIWMIDKEGCIIDCNDKFAEYIGASREKILGFNMLKSARDPVLVEPIQRALRGETVSLETPYTSTNGNRSSWYQHHFQPVTIDGKFSYLLAFIEDISVRKMAEAHVDYLAHHDPLTGLANRVLLKDRLRLAVANSARSGKKLALCFIDLDHFKNVNDSVGHTLGDTLLVTIAKRLQACIRESDTLARIGGDEFVILLGNIGDSSDCVLVAEKVIKATARPVSLEAQAFGVTASIGIALYPDDGDDAETLTRNADLAMYQAKERGRNNYQFFAAEMNSRAQELQAMEAALRVAIEGDQLRLHFQPQVDAHDGRIIGAEALVRWQHPEQGLVPPIRFIPLAEERGLIGLIGDWVLRTACREARSWQQAGFAPLPVAVNISALQFKRGQLHASVLNALGESGLDPHYLVLEITESALMEDIEPAIALLSELRAMGIAIEIDDFGTGYSSLAYLKRLPIHRLKIDQSFVRGIPGDRDDVAIVSAVISLANSLNLTTIAEGVETAEQAQHLIRLGCLAMQGYHYARPLPGNEFAALLAVGRIVPPAQPLTHRVTHNSFCINKCLHVLDSLDEIPDALEAEPKGFHARFAVAL